MGFADQQQNNTIVKNPCTKYYKCKSGVISYYDKDKQTDISVTNLEVLVLSDFPSVWTGYDDSLRLMIQTHVIYDWNKEQELWHWSNGKRNTIAKGFYRKNPRNSDEELFKLKVKDKCKLNKVVFGIDLASNEYIQITFPTGQYNPVKDKNPDWTKQYVKFTGKEETTNEKLNKKYFIPSFEILNLSPEQIGIGKQMATKVTEFFDSQKSINQEQEPKNTPEYDAAKENLQKQKVDPSEVVQEEKQNIPTIKYESDIKPEDLPWQ